MFYDNTIFLSQTIALTNLSAKFIISSFNKNTWNALHIIAIYKPQKWKWYILIQLLKPY
jgi:hypothetical protein